MHVRKEFSVRLRRRAARGNKMKKIKFKNIIKLKVQKRKKEPITMRLKKEFPVRICRHAARSNLFYTNQIKQKTPKITKNQQQQT